MADALKPGSASASPQLCMSHALEAAGGARALVSDPALPGPVLLRPCQNMRVVAVDANASPASPARACDAAAVQPIAGARGALAARTASISPAVLSAGPCSSSSGSSACCSPATSGKGAASISSSRSTPVSSMGGSPTHCALDDSSSSSSSCAPTTSASPTSDTPGPGASCGAGGAGNDEHQACGPRLHAALLPGLFLLAADSADAAVAVEVPCTAGRQQTKRSQPSVAASVVACSRVADPRARLHHTVSHAARRTHLDSFDCYSVSAPAASLSASAAAGKTALLLPCSRVRYALAALEELAGVCVQRLALAPRAPAACAGAPVSAFAFASAAAAGDVVAVMGSPGCMDLPAVPLQPAASAPAAGGQRCTTGGLADGVDGAAAPQVAVAAPPLRVLSARPELITAAAQSSSKQPQVDSAGRRSDGGSSGAAGTDGSPTHTTFGSSSNSSSSKGNSSGSTSSCGDLAAPKDSCSHREACRAAAEWEDSPRAVLYGDSAAGPTATYADATDAGAPSTPLCSVANLDACLATCYQNPLAAYGNMGSVDCSYRNPLCCVNDGGGTGRRGDDDGADDDGGEDMFAMPVMPLNALLTTWSVSSRGGLSRGGSGGGAPSCSVANSGGAKVAYSMGSGSSSTGGDKPAWHAGSPASGLVRTLQGSEGSRLAVSSKANTFGHDA
ncbi:hypothetical protein HXX76_011390 [Chlamydomonas incerta]|uniref:Uncharacterized protein n=1 Tax=Chlamydomonas incerta TaxID=51695 RepID=A0A835SXL7_CHLIN|nr:hypothetical protein HXX76_011390 [Chlamydomonas incerta]|eukprot:KAG2428685.1 hypothetical protein HXX76_011390 [Chlamydomonas incerta]